jgi:Na+/H+ antiporter NhaD/arsenite permease-like protein
MKTLLKSLQGKTILTFSAIMMFFLLPLLTSASNVIPSENEAISIGGIRIEFILFALTLICVGIFHDHTFLVAILGLAFIVLYRIFFAPINFTEHFFGTNTLIDQILNKDMRQGEWSIIINLLGLLLGFAILAKIFEQTRVPDILPNYLPDDWKGPFVLLIFVFVLSSFLDNIAAAMIGGAIALVVFKNKVHLGFIAAIVAASNAGGSGSVLGDTTTTMMWIDGVSALNVLHGFIAAGAALFFFAWFASRQQDKYQRIQKDATPGVKVEWGNMIIVILILAGAIITNIWYDMPALGVWVAVLIGATFRKLPWSEVRSSVKGTIFLLCLVTAASLMPVETLPDASWKSAFILGFVSAVFDNIPLTKLCLDQGHFDWGMLAYSVGFGGSMIWFGSSAGVAITNKFPEGRNVIQWVRKGWHVIIAYIIGFFVLFAIMGWEPASNKKHIEPPANCKAKDCRLRDEAIFNGK